MPLTAQNASTEINFQNLVATHVNPNTLLTSSDHHHQQRGGSGGRSGPAALKKSPPADDGEDECEEAEGEDDESGVTFDFDKLEFDSLDSLGSLRRQNGGGAGNLTSVIERIERSYANPLWMAPISEDEYDDEQPLTMLLNGGGGGESDSGAGGGGGGAAGSSSSAAPKNKKKRKRPNRGDCYESDDSLIDDSELIAEKEEHARQKKSTTKHGGFFVNAGDIVVDSGSEEEDEDEDEEGWKKKRKVMKTGNPRNDFINQHLGGSWLGYTQLLQREIDAFATLSLQHSHQDTKRLPLILEAPLEQLDVIVRTSTGMDRRPYPYIAALMNALPSFGKSKVMQTLRRLDKRNVATEYLRESAAARADFAVCLKVRLQEFFREKEEKEKDIVWNSECRLLLYKAVRANRIWVEKVNLYRQELTRIDTDVLGFHADEWVDPSKEKKVFVAGLLDLFPSDRVKMNVAKLKEEMDYGKKLYKEEEERVRLLGEREASKNGGGKSGSGKGGKSGGGKGGKSGSGSFGLSDAVAQRRKSFIEREGPRDPRTAYSIYQAAKRREMLQSDSNLPEI